MGHGRRNRRLLSVLSCVVLLAVDGGCRRSLLLRGDDPGLARGTHPERPQAPVRLDPKATGLPAAIGLASSGVAGDSADLRPFSLPAPTAARDRLRELDRSEVPPPAPTPLLDAALRRAEELERISRAAVLEAQWPSLNAQEPPPILSIPPASGSKRPIRPAATTSTTQDLQSSQANSNAPSSDPGPQPDPEPQTRPDPEPQTRPHPDARTSAVPEAMDDAAAPQRSEIPAVAVPADPRAASSAASSEECGRSNPPPAPSAELRDVGEASESENGPDQVHPVPPAQDAEAVFAATPGNLTTVAGAPSSAPADPPTPSAVLDTALPAFENRTPLTIRAMQICREVRGFGDVDPLDSRSLRAGQTILLYCELDGLRDLRIAAGFVSRIHSRVELFRSKDGAPIWSQDLGVAEDHCARRRRDSFANCRITLPVPLPPGDYRLRLIQNDLVEGGSASADIALTIVP